MKKNIIFFLISLLVLWNVISCSNNAVKDAKESAADSSKDYDDKALTLLKTNCFTCHNPSLETDNRVAPPMFKIRQHYLGDEKTEEDFVKSIVRFINNPTEENSIMPGAVRNFGIMPKMSFKEDEMKLIAAYLYKNDVSSDEWYAKWAEFEKEQAGKPVAINYEDWGRNIANQTKANLGKNLMAAVKNKGAAGAVEFCNTKAIFITDSMSEVLHGKVKRVSDKPRNPNNRANSSELDYIENWRKAKLAGEKLGPKVFESNNKMIGYYSIETNEMCMKCHGIPEKQIAPETMNKIKQLYPTDKAVGYGENEIRGIFVVEMDKK